MNYKRIFLHVLYWISFILIFPVLFGAVVYNDLSRYLEQVRSLTLGCLYLIPFTYFITYILIQKILINSRKYLLFIILFLSSIIAVSYIDIYLYLKIIIPIYYPELIASYNEYKISLIALTRPAIILSAEIFIFISTKYIFNYFKSYLEKEKLKLKVTEAELKMIRSQIHPHFLFNTLNNIYTLSLETKNNKLSDSIAKLSELLRYTLHESNNKFITIKKESELIFNYLTLEQLRYKDLTIDVNIENEVNDLYTIPLLLFTFIENAFKHGLSNSISEKYLYLKIYKDQEEIIYHIKNSKGSSKNNLFNHSDGIGLKNIKKRLDLSLGNNNYLLQIKDNNDHFEVFLKHKIISI